MNLMMSIAPYPAVGGTPPASEGRSDLPPLAGEVARSGEGGKGGKK